MPVPADQEDQEDLVNDTTGIGGESYYPMDDNDGADANDAPDNDGDADTDLEPPDEESMKPGARALSEIHAHFHDLADVISRLSEGQEHPEVVELIDDVTAAMDECAKKIEEGHGRIYPEYPPLAPPGEDEEEGDGGEVTKSLDGMNETEGEAGGYSVQPDDARLKRLAARRKHFLSRLSLSRKWRELTRVKRMSKSCHGMITKAASFLEGAGDHSGEWTDTHQAAAAHHAGNLRMVCKDYDAAQSGTEGDLERGGVMGKSLNSADAARLAAYDAKVPALTEKIGRLERQLRRAQRGQR